MLKFLYDKNTTSKVEIKMEIFYILYNRKINMLRINNFWN